jgi:hypothetical protein
MLCEYRSGKKQSSTCAPAVRLQRHILLQHEGMSVFEILCCSAKTL